MEQHSSPSSLNTSPDPSGSVDITTTTMYQCIFPECNLPTASGFSYCEKCLDGENPDSRTAISSDATSLACLAPGCTRNRALGTSYCNNHSSEAATLTFDDLRVGTPIETTDTSQVRCLGCSNEAELGKAYCGACADIFTQVVDSTLDKKQRQVRFEEREIKGPDMKQWQP